jgi:hypothetical protein
MARHWWKANSWMFSPNYHELMTVEVRHIAHSTTNRHLTLFLSLSMALQFLNLYIVGRTPWTGDQSVARPLPTHGTTQTQNKLHRHPCLEWNSNPRSQCPWLRRRGHCDRWHPSRQTSDRQLKVKTDICLTSTPRRVNAYFSQMPNLIKWPSVCISCLPWEHSLDVLD